MRARRHRQGEFSLVIFAKRLGHVIPIGFPDGERPSVRTRNPCGSHIISLGLEAASRSETGLRYFEDLD